ncbi:MAG: urea transporter, partial [Paludibacter sp.]
MKKSLATFRNLILPATLNSYSVIFFFNNKLFSIVLFIVTFFNFFAGVSGLIAVLVSVFLANSMGLNKAQLKQGLFSFNALLTGIGMGTFFDPSWVYFSLLILASLLTLMLSVTLSGWLNKYGLPVLSIPFVITFWFIVLPASQFENLGLTQRNIYWMNEMYSMGGSQLLAFFQNLDNFPVHKLIETYLKAISSIFFQENIIAGFLIAISLLICSRIAFSLSIIGFLSAYFFAQFTGSQTASITYYNIGANYMMVAIAIGGFFIIPSRYSYLWTVLLVPLTSLILLFMDKLLGFIQLPIFSLPFSFVVILFVYFLQLRTNPTKLIITPIQYYSPEINLYTFLNNKTRLSHLVHYPLYMPFWGDWKVSQGYDGKYTHKGEWGKAFDFMIYDDQNKSYQNNGLLCEDYYCYNKPILAPADGYIEQIIDNVDENEIGKVDTANNWGNTIIIKHLQGLYTQLSHIKKGSFKVAIGDYVHRGQIIAHCGNSGRSPEPHLHYQVQVSPIIGSKTIDYPFAYFHKKNSTNLSLMQYVKPMEDDIVSGISV